MPLRSSARFRKQLSLTEREDKDENEMSMPNNMHSKTNNHSFLHDSWLIFTKRFYTLKNYEIKLLFSPQKSSNLTLRWQKGTVFKRSNLFIRGGKLSSSSDKEMKKYAKMVFLWTDDEKQKKNPFKMLKTKGDLGGVVYNFGEASVLIVRFGYTFHTWDSKSKPSRRTVVSQKWAFTRGRWSKKGGFVSINQVILNNLWLSLYITSL